MDLTPHLTASPRDPEGWRPLILGIYLGITLFAGGQSNRYAYAINYYSFVSEFGQYS